MPIWVPGTANDDRDAVNTEAQVLTAGPNDGQNTSMPQAGQWQGLAQETLRPAGMPAQSQRLDHDDALATEARVLTGQWP